MQNNAGTPSRCCAHTSGRPARNPEGAASRGLWADVKFLEKTGTSEFNQQLEHTQFGDFHSHGWIFRAVYKHDRKGTLLDDQDHAVPFGDPDKFKKAVHLKDIHLEKGMHCVDCHFEQDNHGNGKLYGETRNAVEIDCVDCHGTIQQKATLTTSGTAAPSGCCVHPGRSGAFTGKMIVSTRDRCSTKIKNGKSSRSSTRLLQGTRTTARNHGSPRPFSRTVVLGGSLLQMSRKSPIRTVA